MKEKTLLRKSELFVEVLITPQKNVSKGSYRKMKKLVRLVLWTKDERNLHLRNVLDVDLKITDLQDLRNHQRKMRKFEIKYV